MANTRSGWHHLPQHRTEDGEHAIDLRVRNVERRHEAEGIGTGAVDQQPAFPSLLDDRCRDVTLKVEGQQQTLTTHRTAAMIA